MIRIANESDFSPLPFTESAVRIHALKRAYGMEMPFLRFYSDGEGALLSVMDGVGILNCPREPSEEWLTFLLMNPIIETIHCPAVNGEILLESGMFEMKQGMVMTYDGVKTESPSGIDENPYLPAVYVLLKDHFEGISDFNAWYPDVSHRVRHECSRVACVCEGQHVISTAMTVAETDTAAIIGQVATHPDHRRKGLAGKCIKSLLSRCEGKTLYILPLNENARHLYEKLGFRVHSAWMELHRKN